MLMKSLTTALLGLATLAQAVNPVEQRGQDFVDTVANTRFVIIGVDYQPGGQAGYIPQSGVDPLSNGTVCLRDAALMQRLGVNTIRVYNIDPALDHNACASIFNAAGIYMILDVNSPLPGESIDRSNPGASYYAAYLQRIFGIVEAFKDFPNTLGFFAANEVINDIPTAEPNPPYIRAVQRDLKNYIARHASRTIPVGYSAADVREVLVDSWAYLQCTINGTSDLSRSDFFGLNSYSWCGGDDTFETSGYNQLVEFFGNTTIPVFFSEYGCNRVMPRVFNEVQALYGPQMTTLSGGLVYEYSQEDSDYGLVILNENGTVTLRVDFDNLQSQLNGLDISIIESTNSTASSLTPPPCSPDLISNSGFSKDFDIPPPPPGAQDLIDNGIPNPNNGRLIQISDFNVNVPVYASNGNQIQGLFIRPVADSNRPSGESTSGNATGSGTASAPSATASRTGAASSHGVAMFFMVIFLAMATTFLL